MIETLQIIRQKLQKISGYGDWHVYPNLYEIGSGGKYSPAVGMKLPAYRKNNDIWSPHFDYADEEKSLKNFLGDQSFRISFEDVGNRDTPMETALLIRGATPQDIEQAADCLAAKQDIFKKAVQSLVLKATPDSVFTHLWLDDVASAIWEDLPQNEAVPMGKLVAAGQRAFNNKAGVAELVRAGRAYETLQSMIEDEALPDRIRESLYGLVPAANPQFLKIPVPAPDISSAPAPEEDRPVCGK